MSFLKDLNPVQQEAVKAREGPVMIIAGAGSGKTRVLTYKVAYLISLGVRPYEILALTFTNKAANEMRSRIVDLVGPKSQEVWMGTFHSTLARILRIECERIGFGRNFTIYDTDEGLGVIKGIMNSIGLSQQQFSPNAIRNRISLAKNQMLSAKEYGRLASDLLEERTAQIYEEYQKRLHASNAMDFDDLLVKPIELFERHPKTAEKYQLRFKYLLVDEYQDTNRTQYILIKKLAERHQNICVVGDDAQSIYAFRGADIRNILDFERDYPGFRLYRLEQNYRSTKTVLAAADQIIKNNRDQIQKNLWTNNPQGDPITVLDCEDERDEGYQIAERIQRESSRRKLDLKDFAVLYRTNAQSRALEDALRRNTIPYTIVGGVEFYKRKEIKDVLAYFKLILNPKDDESLLRIINYPARGIGETTLKKVKSLAAQQGGSLMDALGRVDSVREIGSRTKGQIREFLGLVNKYIRLKESMSTSELARALVDDLGILPEFKREGTPDAMNRWENVQELLSAVLEFTGSRPDTTLGQFLEEVCLISDVDTWDDERNVVTLMTLHSAKGLEFPVLFITGLEEGLFPLYPSEIDRVELEEERRLFYVGVTRTMRKLFLSYVRSRVRYGEVIYPVRSRFVDEIPVDLMTIERKGIRRRERFRFEEETLDKHLSFLRKPGVESAPSIELDFQSSGFEFDNGFERPSKGAGFVKVGSIVEHETFGRGQVLGVSGSGDSAKAVVQFHDFGRKHLMLKYANLKVV